VPHRETATPTQGQYRFTARHLEKVALPHYSSGNSRNSEVFSMARITVEDCVDKVPNRFELVLLSAHRARMISNGSPLTLDRENDKNPVVALREIADESVSPEDLNEDLIHSLQKYVEVDEPEPAPTPIEADAPEDDGEVTFDRMSEEELLRGLESIDPPERRDD